MKKLLCIALSSLLLIGCGKDDGRTYIGDNNYYTMVDSEGGEFEGWDFTAKVEPFPKYFVYRAKEWPLEDINDESSYELPRVQFTWANMVEYRNKEPHPLFNDYEGQVKLWSMKTDGTDLRLVTDFEGLLNHSGDARAKIVRSPNNRYVAFNHYGSKSVLDLKTREVTTIGERSGVPGYLWAEDSSYLYFRNGHSDVYKWEVATGDITQMEFTLRDASRICNGIQYVVSDVGVSVYSEDTGERLPSVPWGLDLKIEEARSEHRSISPDCKMAYAGNRSNTFEMNMIEGTSSSDGVAMRYASSIGGQYGLSNRHATVIAIRDYENKIAWDWRPLGHNRTLDPVTIYNVEANKGAWFKEQE